MYWSIFLELCFFVFFIDLGCFEMEKGVFKKVNEFDQDVLLELWEVVVDYMEYLG